MAYTNVWTNDYPASSDDAGDPTSTNEQGVAHDIRRLKLDISERMGSITEDWTADPVVLAPTSSVLGFAKSYISTEDALIVKAMLVVEITVETSPVGFTGLTGAEFTVDFSNFDENWDLNFLVGWQGVFWNNDDNDAAFVILLNTDLITPSLEFRVIDEDGSFQGEKEIQGRFIFLFSAIPT